jgi:hypothetical protein
MSSTHVFPQELKSNQTRPMIRFECLEDSGAIIYLPAPESLQFSDSATYNDTELGFTGKQMSNAASAVTGGGGGIGSLFGAGLNALKNIPKDMGGIIQAASAALPVGEDIKSAISIGTGTTLNKNITSEFTAVGTRAYTFQFQLIPKNTSEADKIKTIVRAFRLGLYPTGNDYQLKYPPKWKIQIVTSPNGTGDLTYLPKIFETCYMTQFSSSYNTGGNIWRTDGAPLDTTINLSFSETRALTKQDVENL